MTKENEIDLMQDIKEYINVVCELLEINPPKLTIGGQFATSTTMAAYNKKLDEVSINPNYYIANIQAFNLLLFAVTHEMRHKWQFENDNDVFRDYHSGDKMSLNDYNSQIVEIDANAFGLAMMDFMFDDWDSFDIHSKLFNNIKTKNRYVSILQEIIDIYGGIYDEN